MVERITLENAGFSVMTSGTGEKAIEVIGSGTTVDLILMDIDLGRGM
ncbi:MAG: histidine kinase, partial [Spirochaetaceae bacterium]